MVDRQAVIQELREKLSPEKKQEISDMVDRLLQHPQSWMRPDDYGTLEVMREIVEG